MVLVKVPIRTWTTKEGNAEVQHVAPDVNVGFALTDINTEEGWAIIEIYDHDLPKIPKEKIIEVIK